MTTKSLMPVLFVSHGSPMLAVEHDFYTEACELLASQLPVPKAIVVMSAHWRSPQPLKVSASPKPSLIYDFSGFPDELYALTYPCSGHPDLAKKILTLLPQKGISAAADSVRGFDHGVWVPLLRLFPKANIPVVAISVPYPRTPQQFHEIGQSLLPLRADGVLIIGSGVLVHNLRMAKLGAKEAPVDPWALQFKNWVVEHIQKNNREALFHFDLHAPYADTAVPTTEHFDPFFFAWGAAGDSSFHVWGDGFQYGNLSTTSFIWK